MIGLIEMRFCTLAHRSHQVDIVGPTEKPNVHILKQVGLTEFGKLCVTARLCVEAINTPPPLSI